MPPPQPTTAPALRDWRITPMFWNITAGLAMFFGRYLSIVIQLAIAGSLMKKRFVNESAGTLRTEHVLVCGDPGIRGLYLCGADLLPRAGAGPHCRTSDSLGLRRIEVMSKKQKLLTPEILSQAFLGSFKKLRPPLHDQKPGHVCSRGGLCYHSDSGNFSGPLW